LHIDKAGESISAEVQAFCKDHGIALSTTATEQHQQNGIAERLNGIILERLTATLASLNAETPPKYWPILALSIIYLTNRSPSSVIGKTPYEAWYGQQPDLAHLRTLGAKGFVQLKRSGHRKLDPVSEHCHMLGYQGSSNYIVLTNSGVTVSNNVIFDEDNTCHLPTPHAEGEAEEEPAEVGNNSSRHNKHETILDTIVVADPDQQSNRRIRHPFPLNQNAMLAYSFLGSISHAAGPSEPPSYRHAKGDSDWPKWLEAMQSEHKSLTDNHTWSLVDRPNRKVLTGKWTYRLKRGANGEILRHKARWVARGFEQTDGVDYSETFASVVKPMSYKAIFAIAAARDLELEQMDVKTAFLYGNIDEEVYIEQPPEFDDGTGRVCKLNKALYGLKQAPRIWYQTLATFLKDLGFHPLTSDVGVFAKEHTYIAVYVDDLLIAGPSKEEIQKLKKALSKRFDMTDLGPCSYYLGMTITRDRKNRTIRLSQKGYIEKILKDFGMCDANPQHTPMKTDQIDKTP
jgi:hypothetical protein